MYGDYVIIVGEQIVKCEHKYFVNLIQLRVFFFFLWFYGGWQPPPSDPEWDQTNKIFVLTNYNVLTHNYPLLTQTQWSESV